MKYFSFILILAWSIWILCTNPNLKFSDNNILFILGCLSIMYSAINFIILSSEFKKHKQTL